MAGAKLPRGTDPRAALTSRNAALFTRYRAGERVVDLARDFGISRARVLEVVRRAQDRRQAELRARARPELISTSQVGHRAMRALTAANITRWDQLADATAESLLRIPRIGPALATTILVARAGLIDGGAAASEAPDLDGAGAS